MMVFVCLRNSVFVGVSCIVCVDCLNSWMLRLVFSVVIWCVKGGWVICKCNVVCLKCNLLVMVMK